MSVKLKNIVSILSENYKASRFPLPGYTWEDLNKRGLTKTVSEVFKNLGGIDPMESFPFPNYHFEFENFALMLDEEPSFNRYRNITLQSEVYNTLNNFPLEKYKSYCKSFEKECLKSASAGHLWTNRLSESFFGRPNENGDLYQNGSPGWKNRAFQDYLIDISPLIVPLKIIRISIYDNILISNNMYKIKDLVLSSRSDLKSALFKYLDRKIKSVVVSL